MIHCSLCPLKDVCTVHQLHTEPVIFPIKLNWLPKEAENECPLLKAINEQIKRATTQRGIMKVKDAHKLLEGYSGDTLFQEASKLYQSEVDGVILLRSHGSKPSSNLIEGAINQVDDWLRKVAVNLQWEKPVIIENIIEWERGRVWVRYGIIDPKLLKWRERTQREVLKGTPLPILEAMGPGDLEAASSMMMARMQEEVKEWSELEERRGTFATQMGKRLCPYGVEERFCKHSITYSLVGVLPTNTKDLVFICMVDKCIKETNG